MNKGARLISEAVIGMDIRVIVVADRRYTLYSPTIHRIAGAGYHLSNITLPSADATIADVIATQNKAKELAAALSWFIKDDESLTEELSQGTIGELAKALETAYSMIDMRDFMLAVGIARCVAELTARPK